MADTKSPDSALESGREALLKGDLDAAQQHYLAGLELEPDNAEVHHALAIVEKRLGHFDRAEQYLHDAIRLNRYGVGFQNSLGDVLVAQHRLREAEAAYFEELRMRPEFSLSHNQLGTLFLQTGNVSRAIKHFQSALQFTPDYAEAAINLGYALYRDGQHKEAAEALTRALELDERSARANAVLGHVKLVQGETTEAAARFERALVLNPNCAEAVRGMADMRLRQGKIQEAIAAYNKVLQLDANNVEATRSLAQIWLGQGLWEVAEQFFRRAHELAPTDLAVLNQLAHLQVERGSTDEAIDSYEKALQLRPSDQDSLAGYGRLKAMTGDTKLALSKLSAVIHSGRAQSNLVAAYARLLGASARRRDGITVLEQRLRTRIPDEEKVNLHFTLGDLLGADASYDLAFHNYRIANQLKQARFDAARFVRVCQHIESAFSKEAMASAPRVGDSGEGLVFMLGMPRAGVKVIEQQLRQHNEIVSMGGSSFVELAAYRLCSEQGFSWPHAADELDQSVLGRYAALYQDRMRLVADQTHVLVDATWRNFLYLGLIELMFPKARIVYCARDYRDIALSCYFTHFSAAAGSTSFAYNMNDIATYINAHKRLMAHWQSVLTLPMHVVTYERMILEYDTEAAYLLRFLGLQGHTDVNDDEERLPQPSSLKSISLRRYRHYKHHLEGLVEMLESPPDKAF
ncbi:MAG: tetratricopeptide repeat protein [Pseudomonadota bacterium]